MEIFLSIILLAIIAAAVKINLSHYRARKSIWFTKTIYNYKGKSQQQIYAILELELKQLDLTNYEIESFSEPLFKYDASADYVVYLKPKKAII